MILALRENIFLRTPSRNIFLIFFNRSGTQRPETDEQLKMYLAEEGEKGEIEHALVICAFYFYNQYLSKGH